MTANDNPSNDRDAARAAFTQQIAQLTASLQGRALDAALQDHLNQTYPPGSAVFESIFKSCRDGVAQGWMCERAAGGIRYGRVIKPCPEIHGYSVDVVEMKDIVGPQHRHPQGEIDLVMPLLDASEGDVNHLVPGGVAEFDGQPAGWKVYGPDTVHSPTVRQGRALVLYLLPQGAIEFTRS